MSRDGGDQLTAELDARRQRAPWRVYVPRQWGDDEFVSIANAIDDVFGAMGWIEATTSQSRSDRIRRFIDLYGLTEDEAIFFDLADGKHKGNIVGLTDEERQRLGSITRLRMTWTPKWKGSSWCRAGCRPCPRRRSTRRTTARVDAGAFQPADHQTRCSGVSAALSEHRKYGNRARRANSSPG